MVNETKRDCIGPKKLASFLKVMTVRRNFLTISLNGRLF